MVDAPSGLDALLGAVARAGSEQPAALLSEVLRAAAGHRTATVWSRSPDGWLRRMAGTGGRLAGPDRVPGPDALRDLPQVALVLPVVDGEVERGVITLGHLPGREPVETREKAYVRDAAAYVALLLRGPQLQEELRRRIDDASRLSDTLAASHERLSYAADLESRRMVADIVAFGGDELASLREQVGRMRAGRHRPETAGTDFRATAREVAQAALPELRRVLDALIDRLRTVVRGIYPHVLDDRGILAALDELVTGMPRAVRLSGDLASVPRDVASGLYWPTAAVLQALAGGADSAAGAPAPVSVRLGLDDGYATVTVIDQVSGRSTALRGVLPMAQDRLAALGGWLEHEAGVGGLVVRLALPEHLTPTVPARIATSLRPPVEPPSTGARSDLRSRVRRLLLAAADVADTQDRPGLWRALARLDEPQATPGRAKAALAGVPAALAVLDECTRHDPQGWLRYEYDRLRSDAHDLDELALLRELQSGELALADPGGQAALRLLGAQGPTAPARLGLVDGADPAQVRAAAAEQAAHWRACAESGTAGPRERAAYRLLARSAEGLLVLAEGGSG